jgi:hypothetical protein
LGAVADTGHLAGRFDIEWPSHHEVDGPQYSAGAVPVARTVTVLSLITIDAVLMVTQSRVKGSIIRTY